MNVTQLRISEKLIDALIGLGFDVARDRYNDSVIEHAYKSALRDYIARQEHFNEIASREEEIDFTGLIEFVRENLIDEVDIRIFAANERKRAEARDYIFNSAVSFAKANTPESKKRVSKFIDDCLDLIRSFHKNAFSKHEMLFAAEIAEVVADNAKEDIAEAKATLKNIEVTVKQIAENHAVQQAALKAVTDGNLEEASHIVGDFFAHLSTGHPLFPHYGFTWQDNVIKSTPLTKDALEKYPPSLRVKGRLHVGDKYFNALNKNVLNYAYRHQEDVVIDVSEAIKFLGVNPDPNQTEIKGLQQLIARPEEFPAAFPCSLLAGDEVVYDYIMMRTQEILDDDTVIVNNREQETAPVFFEIRLKFNNNDSGTGNARFSCSLKVDNNKERRKLFGFRKKLYDGKQLRIKALQYGKIFMEAQLISWDDSDFEQEYDYLTRICEVEDYFNIKLEIDEDCSIEDFKIIHYLSELVRNKRVEGTWDNSSFNGIVAPRLRERLKSIGDQSISLSYDGICKINIFGAQFEFPLKRTYNSARLKNPVKVQKLSELLDDDETIKIDIVPGSNNVFIDELK